MAEKNDKKDQDARTWGQKLRDMFNEATQGKPKKMEEKSAEELVKELKKKPNRY